ncbi:hypothetical protein IEQ34_000039 [Dendrobium chrysotoxum]|uniref:Disease resistance protein winged helix domain-containing protein n=1 Tax=Dendrobium chrysotoxum TaxID=161865 RepID=A0AAV7HNU9_DENCH|nr:hypothetical protein IEQ34_000039 [Dendrobium chrysotoxum]
MEETGREYFDELLGRSLFQAIKFTNYFKMHDLVYDLAVSISDNEFIIMKSEGGNQKKCISNNARHLAIHDESRNNALKGTLVFPFLSRNLLNSIRLRSVHIKIFQSNSNLSKFLDSISSFKHLRYLYISISSVKNPHFEKDALSCLFNSLHSIRNVQVLDLLGCGLPIMLQTSIQILINLRHLILPKGSIMPYGINKLTSLHTLKFVVVKDESRRREERLPSKLQSVWFEDCWKLTSIERLQNLHSLKKLKLIRCPKLKLTLEEKLSTMPSVLEIVDCLGLEEWCQRYGFKIIQELSKMEELTRGDTSHIILNYGSGNLVSLKSLHILELDESDIPKVEWIPCCLQTLHLNSCQRLKLFPPYQNLSALRLLKIWRCTALTCLPGLKIIESLEKLEIIECPQFVLSPDHRLPSKLQFLLISNCPNILCLPGLEQLFSLRKLRLFECPELMLPPPEQLPFMFYIQLELFNSPKIIDWCQRYNIPYNNKKNFTRLKKLRIWDCSDLKELPGLDGVTTLQDLDISNYPNLISSCSTLKYLSGLQNQASLHFLIIDNCPKLCLNDELLPYMLNRSNVKISDCPQLQEWFQNQDVAYI